MSAIRPPGLTTRRSSDNPRTASGNRMTPRTEMAASKLASGNLRFWPSMVNVSIVSPMADARSFVRATIASDASMAVTLWPRRASSKAAPPAPAAESSTRDCGAGASAAIAADERHCVSGSNTSSYKATYSSQRCGCWSGSGSLVVVTAPVMCDNFGVGGPVRMTLHAATNKEAIGLSSFALGLGLTNECNLACAFCYRDPTRTDRLDLEQVRSVVESVPLRSVNLGTGENGMHPDFAEFVNYLRSEPIKLTITSNGY